jgi:O-antigen/teichoic acid export membrane protein
MFVYGDRFIVARYLNSENLSIYTVSQDILIRLLLIPWSMSLALMPVFAADNLGKKEVYEQYRIHNKRINLVSILMVSLFLIFFYPGFYLWLGHDFIHNAVPVIVVQAVGILFCTMSQLPLVYAYAQGAPHRVAVIYGGEALLYLAIGPWAFDKYGIMGAAVIWTSSLVIEYFALNLLAKRLIK